MSTVDVRTNSEYSEQTSRERGGKRGVATPLLDSEKNKKIYQYCESAFEKAKRDRQQFERAWYTNIAFYFGRQYVQWTPSVGAAGQRLIEPAAPSWRVRLISNKIRPIIRAELSKVTKETPQAYVIPASTEDTDLLAARAAEGIVEHLFRTLHMSRMLRRASFWTMLTGTGFLKDWYDPQMEADDTTGAIQVEPLSPFHIYVPDVQEEELDNQEFVIHSLAKSADFIESRFGKRVSPDTRAAGGLEQKFFSALGIQSNPHDAVAVKEGWFRPCKQFPQGAQVTWASGSILSITEETIYEHAEFPITKFSHIPTGRFYADSTIPDLIPLQKEYNKTRSQIIESKNRMSKPQLMAPKGSVDANKLTSEPGLVIFYTPGMAPPQPLPLQNIPAYVIQELDRIQRDMDDISSQHEVTKGATPPGVTAATAIAYLQEEDDSKLAWTITSIEEGVERIGRHFLSHVNQFWDAERSVRVMGMNDAYETQMLSNSDIRGNTDFKIQAGSALPRSRAAKQAFLMELGKLGWIPPDRALRYMDMAETGKLHEEMQIDSRQVQRENIRMSQGEGIEEGEPNPETGEPMQFMAVNSYDNHAAHIAEHDSFRKTQKFEQLPPELKAVFETHVQMHHQLLSAERGQMIPPGMRAPENPAEAGQPGTPSMGNPAAGGQTPSPEATTDRPPGPQSTTESAQ